MTVSIKVRNKDKLYAQLRKTVPGIEEALQDALEQNGEEWVEKARSYAPVDEGDLRRSIRWSKNKPNDTSGTMVMAGQTFTHDAPHIYLMAGDRKAWYARFVEFGTAPGVRGERTGKAGNKQHKELGRIVQRNHPGTRPQPFFFPSYRLLRRKLRGRMTRAMTKAIKKAGFGTK